MVRRRLIGRWGRRCPRPRPWPRLLGALLACALPAVAACGGTERDTAERMDMPDSLPVVRALKDGAARDRLLDTMPGGEMARGDSAAAMQLLKKKM